MESEQLQLLIGIDNKVDEVKEKLHSIELVQTRMESDLKYHIKRTDLLEEKVMEVSEKVEPIESAKTIGTFIAKVFAIITAIIMTVATVMRIISKE